MSAELSSQLERGDNMLVQVPVLGLGLGGYGGLGGLGATIWDEMGPWLGGKNRFHVVES